MAKPTLQEMCTTLLNTAVEAVSGHSGNPKHAFVAHGEVAWDDTDDGLVYVRVLRTFLASGVVEVDQPPLRCNSNLAASIEVVHVTCAPKVKSQGPQLQVPSDDEIAASASKQNGCATSLMRALRDLHCTWQDTLYIASTVSEWTPLGPTGGALGGTITMTVELP